MIFCGLAVAVDCGSLGVPVNGSRQGLSTTFPNAMQFQCNEGFVLSGSSSRVCQANRTWSGEEAQCIGRVFYYMSVWKSADI